MGNVFNSNEHKSTVHQQEIAQIKAYIRQIDELAVMLEGLPNDENSETYIGMNAILLSIANGFSSRFGAIISKLDVTGVLSRATDKQQLLISRASQTLAKIIKTLEERQLLYATLLKKQQESEEDHKADEVLQGNIHKKMVEENEQRAEEHQNSILRAIMMGISIHDSAFSDYMFAYLSSPDAIITKEVFEFATIMFDKTEQELTQIAEQMDKVEAYKPEYVPEIVVELKRMGEFLAKREAFGDAMQKFVGENPHFATIQASHSPAVSERVLSRLSPAYDSISSIRRSGNVTEQRCQQAVAGLLMRIGDRGAIAAVDHFVKISQSHINMGRVTQQLGRPTTPEGLRDAMSWRCEAAGAIRAIRLLEYNLPNMPDLRQMLKINLSELVVVNQRYGAMLNPQFGMSFMVPPHNRPQARDFRHI